MGPPLFILGPRAGCTERASGVRGFWPYSTTRRRTVSLQNGIGGAVRWLDGPTANALVLHSADDHYAFHEDAKPGDGAGQFPIRWRSSSNQLVTR